MITLWSHKGKHIETKHEKQPIGDAATAWDAEVLCIAHNRQEKTFCFFTWRTIPNREIKIPGERARIFALTPDDANQIVLAHNKTTTKEETPKPPILNQQDIQKLALEFSKIKFNSRTSKTTKRAVINAQFKAYERGLERARNESPDA